jgi:hypothetical protein
MAAENGDAMTGKTLLNRVVDGQTDAVALLPNLLKQTGTDYCVIGRLAVDVYTEPVISLDLDLVVVTDKVRALCDAASAKGIKIERFEHRIGLSVPGSNLRIQLQTDPRYQEFIGRAVQRNVLGYTMAVAAMQDVPAGKIRAYCDEQRRKSKRQKDLADILRVAEMHPELKDRLPPEIESQVE